ncbi:hypothetical protein [Trinickia soli]|uniref:Uncharacterized protein n=1 Tax=Trinickia soli TaxID=380675 RepID=A0A2N7W7A5_9BURK|nr:hypothetical protein [Trinickia soli]PMS25287.1 hypothetical protein C0Z19_10060 [Trinickia soli]CAB3688342.1 hypothetical protein LMG24076_02796 [Trinickia soli]
MASKRKNPCSLVVVNERNGNVLRGTSAILHATSRAGGFDKYMQDYGNAIQRNVFDALIEGERKPHLRRAS